MSVCEDDRCLAVASHPLGDDAAFDNGVLTITIAKPADVVTKSHPIRIAGKTTGKTTGKISDKKPDKKPDKTVTEATT
ncbi:MAG: hypothetical protein VXB94_08815 [Rhodobiaceae bacterium]